MHHDRTSSSIIEAWPYVLPPIPYKTTVFVERKLVTSIAATTHASLPITTRTTDSRACKIRLPVHQGSHFRPVSRRIESTPPSRQHLSLRRCYNMNAQATADQSSRQRAPHHDLQIRHDNLKNESTVSPVQYIRYGQIIGPSFSTSAAKPGAWRHWHALKQAEPSSHRAHVLAGSCSSSNAAQSQQQLDHDAFVPVSVGTLVSLPIHNNPHGFDVLVLYLHALEKTLLPPV